MLFQAFRPYCRCQRYTQPRWFICNSPCAFYVEKGSVSFLRGETTKGCIWADIDSLLLQRQYAYTRRPDAQVGNGKLISWHFNQAWMMENEFEQNALSIASRQMKRILKARRDFWHSCNRLNWNWKNSKWCYPPDHSMSVRFMLFMQATLVMNRRNMFEHDIFLAFDASIKMALMLT